MRVQRPLGEEDPLPPPDPVAALMQSPEVDAEEAAAFDAYAAALTVRFWPWLGVMLALSAALWWPLDALVFAGDPHAIDAFAAFRPRVIALDLTLAWAAPRVALFRRHAHLVATLAAVSNVSMSGWLLAEAGRGDPWWLSFAFIMPIFSVLLLVPLAARVGATLTLAAGVVSAWYAHPDAQAAAAGATVSYMGFICAVSIFIGHLLFVQVRRSFHLTGRLDRKRRALRDLADTLELQVEAKTEQLRAWSDRAQLIRSEQRREIARDLHDGLGQELTSLRLSVGIQRRLLALPEDAFADLDAQVAELQNSLRRVLQAIRPQHLEEAALPEALATLTDEMERRSGLRCRFVAHNASSPLPAAVSVTLFRVAQEAITNAVRHARARCVEVRLERGRQAVELTVQDDGHGFDPARLGSGFGTQNIAERVASLGGSVAWTFDAGTRLRVVLPLES